MHSNKFLYLYHFAKIKEARHHPHPQFSVCFSFIYCHRVIFFFTFHRLASFHPFSTRFSLLHFTFQTDNKRRKHLTDSRQLQHTIMDRRSQTTSPRLYDINQSFALTPRDLTRSVSPATPSTDKKTGLTAKLRQTITTVTGKRADRSHTREPVTPDFSHLSTRSQVTSLFLFHQ